ncbi:MAG: hypothetical protein QOK24_312 [Verrucomicrobiota bacterium]|jgi:hypothetical protein
MGLLGHKLSKLQMTWLSLAFCHLLIVCFGGFGIPISSFLPPPFDGIISGYSSYSGASAGYGFFSPDIADQIVARVEMRRGDSILCAKLFENNRDEAETRLSGLVMLLSDIDRDDVATKLIAARCFGVVDDLQTVKVSLEYVIVPSLAEYRNGSVEHYRPFYEAEFVRRASQ